MHQEEKVVRLYRPDDINVLKKLDLRTHQYPMPMNEWRDNIKRRCEDGSAEIIIIDVMDKPIAFAMWAANKKEKFVHLLRLGVVPEGRRNGAGSLLMRACYEYAYKHGMDYIKIVVPDVNCQPGDPDDVTGFLSAVGFEATGEIIHNWRTMYGNNVDGYIFKREIHVTPIM